MRHPPEKIAQMKKEKIKQDKVLISVIQVYSVERADAVI
jgi:hypothetical protein